MPAEQNTMIETLDDKKNIARISGYVGQNWIQINEVNYLYLQQQEQYGGK